MDYKEIFEKLTQLSDKTTATDIIFVLAGFRSGVFGGIHTISKAKKLMRYIDDLQDDNIRYEFWNDGEGYLLYNIKYLSQKTVNLIEKSGVNKLYTKKVFGEILGYETPLNLDIQSKRNTMSFSINVSYPELHKKYGKTQMRTKHELYTFISPKSKFDEVKQKLLPKLKKMNKFIKSIDNDARLELSIKYEFFD